MMINREILGYPLVTKTWQLNMPVNGGFNEKAINDGHG